MKVLAHFRQNIQVGLHLKIFPEFVHFYTDRTWIIIFIHGHAWAILRDHCPHLGTVRGSNPANRKIFCL